MQNILLHILLVFGGSNTKGTVATSNVHIYDGHINEVYGGNNAGGNTITAHITVHENGSVANVYGGGNEAKQLKLE